VEIGARVLRAPHVGAILTRDSFMANCAMVAACR